MTPDAIATRIRAVAAILPRALPPGGYGDRDLLGRAAALLEEAMDAHDARRHDDAVAALARLETISLTGEGR